VAGISFERAADFYDATRGLPRDVHDALMDVLAAELSGRGRCVEIGVGTGRIALGLHRRGVELVGADISRAMLERLVANSRGRMPFPLLLADATGLPLRRASCGAVLASHVLHLIGSWTVAVDEAMRVLAPGGVLLVDFGGGTPAPWSGAARDAMRRHGVLQVRPGVSSAEQLAGYLEGRIRLRPLTPVTLTVARTLARDLDEWERQIHSWTWPYSPGQLRHGCEEVRRWAAAQGWPLEREVTVERTIRWWAFERRA
jgi:ubiquinone/menaquinone biosynthesis C-methylase UbiE